LFISRSRLDPSQRTCFSDYSSRVCHLTLSRQILLWWHLIVILFYIFGIFLFFGIFYIVSSWSLCLSCLVLIMIMIISKFAKFIKRCNFVENDFRRFCCNLWRAINRFIFCHVVSLLIMLHFVVVLHLWWIKLIRNCCNYDKDMP